MPRYADQEWFSAVAPARERGLKYDCCLLSIKAELVAPVRERGLKSAFVQFCSVYGTGRSREGAWIEMRPIIASYAFALVALARECGLKLHESCKGGCNFVIRSRKGAWIEMLSLMYGIRVST